MAARFSMTTTVHFRSANRDIGSAAHGKPPGLDLAKTPLFLRSIADALSTGIAVFPILADVVEVKTGSRSTAHWRIHFIRSNGWLRHSFAQLITLLDIDGIGQNWEGSNTSRCRSWLVANPHEGGASDGQGGGEGQNRHSCVQAGAGCMPRQ